MKLNDKTLIKRVKKKVKKAIGVGWLSKPNEEQSKILEDIQYMTIGLAHFVLMDKFKTKEEYLECVNAFLSFEEVTFNYSAPLKYEVGKMALVCGRINIKHKLIEFEKAYSQDKLREAIKKEL